MNESSNNETQSYVLSTTVIVALEILEFIGHHQPVNPPDIAKSLGLTRSKVHRILATLVSTGYVVRDSNEYCLSFKLFHLGNSIPSTRDLKRIARPLMVKLMQEVNENVYLNVLSGDMIVGTDLVKSDNHLTLNAEKVILYPINSCASGKVFLSMLTKEAAAKTIKNLNMKRMTDFTITDRQLFIEEIEKVKRQGYALEIREFSEELNSLAVPVYDHMDQIIATISLSGPSARFTMMKIESSLEVILRTGREVTQRLRK